MNSNNKLTISHWIISPLKLPFNMRQLELKCLFLDNYRPS